MLHNDRMTRFEIRKGFVLRLNYRAGILQLELTDVQTGEQQKFSSLEDLTLHLENLIRPENKN
jgi:hypothetical protein